jgi:hypothetical protein
MLTETQKKFWFEVFFRGVKIGEGDEESKNLVVYSYMNAHKEIYWTDYENEFVFKLVSTL